jgi:predicted O-methyltransferase YrrM
MNDWIRAADNVRSAYAENNLGWFFYSLVRMYKPAQCVEIGVFQGYSAIYTLAGLRDARHGEWIGFDLFDNYLHRHCTLKQADDYITSAGLDPTLVQLNTATEAYFHERFPDMVDLLHVDVSNNGAIYKEYLKYVAPEHVNPGGFLVFEGGSKERDQAEWMLKYGFEPMNPIVEDESIWAENWYLHTRINLFPSITAFVRK